MAEVVAIGASARSATRTATAARHGVPRAAEARIAEGTPTPAAVLPADGDGATGSADAAASSADGGGQRRQQNEAVGEAELDGDVLATLDADIAAEAEEAGADA